MRMQILGAGAAAGSDLPVIINQRRDQPLEYKRCRDNISSLYSSQSIAV
jgi:hypothetical protein